MILRYRLGGSEASSTTHQRPEGTHKQGHPGWQSMLVPHIKQQRGQAEPEMPHYESHKHVNHLNTTVCAHPMMSEDSVILRLTQSQGTQTYLPLPGGPITHTVPSSTNYTLPSFLRATINSNQIPSFSCFSPLINAYT
jgi:hypothetical protein